MNLYEYIDEQNKEFVLIKQLLCFETSVGAKKQYNLIKKKSTVILIIPLTINH